MPRRPVAPCRRGQSHADAPRRRSFLALSSLLSWCLAVVSCVHVELVEPRAHRGSCLQMHGDLPNAEHRATVVQYAFVAS